MVCVCVCVCVCARRCKSYPSPLMAGFASRHSFKSGNHLSITSSTPSMRPKSNCEVSEHQINKCTDFNLDSPHMRRDGE